MFTWEDKNEIIISIMSTFTNSFFLQDKRERNSRVDAAFIHIHKTLDA